jgi:hypothetical protein
MPRLFRAALFFLAITPMAACASSAHPSSPFMPSAPRAVTTGAIQRVFRAPRAEPQWFAPSFLADTPLDQVQAMVDLIRETLGDYQGATGEGDEYLVRFSAGQRRIQAKLDEEGRFVVFVVGPA